MLTMSERRNRSSRPTSSNSEFSREPAIRVGIVGDQLHVERLDHPEKFGADIPDADRPQRTADETGAHVIASARKSGRPFAGQSIFDHEFAGERENERDD